MRGTWGYLALEWLTNSAISDWIDVYNYGMVLFEIICGRKNCSLPARCEASARRVAVVFFVSVGGDRLLSFACIGDA